MDRVLVPKTLQLFDQGRRRNSLDRTLTRRIDVQNQHNICKIERARKIIEEMKGPRIAMRLEDRENAAEITRFGGAKRGPNLGGMMSIIVDDSHPIARF